MADPDTKGISDRVEPLRVCREKFDGFKALCHQVIPHNPFVAMLQHVPLETFIHLMKIHAHQFTGAKGAFAKGAFGGEDELVQRICHKMDVEESQFSPEISAKFRQYVRYFMKLARTL